MAIAALCLVPGFLFGCHYILNDTAIPDFKGYSMCLKHADKGYCNTRFREAYNFLIKYNLEIKEK